MATSIETFLKNAMEIANAKPIYTKNGDSKDECDCIGLIIGALKMAGVTWSGLHGSNYAARQSVDDFHPISSAKDLAPGMIVFKVYPKGDDRWTLDKYPRYLPGGKYYNGDLNDYYHVGIVVSASPLKIVHMTTPTSTEDDKLGRWSYAGWLKNKYISDAHDTTPAPAPEPAEEKKETPAETATVYAESGSTVKMRAKPSTSSSLYWDIPVGSVVQVLERGKEWSKISNGINTGYMKTMFLKNDQPNCVLHIPGLTREQAVELAGKYTGAWITEGVG